MYVHASALPSLSISTAQSSRPKSFMYEAEFDFTAVGPGQLSLKQGEQVTHPFHDYKHCISRILTLMFDNVVIL